MNTLFLPIRRGVFLTFLFLLCISCPSEPTTDTNNTSPEDDAEYSFSFVSKEHKVARTENSYPYPVTETNTPSSDKRAITYISAEDEIATVDKNGLVTFKTAGTVMIIATKDAEGELEEVSDSYMLYITMKPIGIYELAGEINRAMSAYGDMVDLNYIDTSLITDMSYLFDGSDNGYGLGTFNGDISEWDVSQVTNMYSMFSEAEVVFNGDISKWDVSQVTNMRSMFYQAHVFNSDISEWKVGKVIDMSYMFMGAEAFNKDISKWDVSQVTDMDSMFFDAMVFNKDISKWNVSKVTDMNDMFYGATVFTQVLNCWADRINPLIKANNWSRANEMFEESGLKGSEPTWYKTTDTTSPAGCTVNPKDKNRDVS